MALSITSGLASGIRLDAPKGLSVRPTSVRAKHALFDSISVSLGWEGKCVVDLFSGTGALGLEAASRGASSAYLIEQSSNHCKIAEKNVEKVKNATKSTSPEIVLCRSNALFAYNRLSHLSGQIDIILSDPPYAQSANFLEKIINDAKFAKWAGDALLIWEAPDKFDLSVSADSFWIVKDSRNFAGTDFLYLYCNIKNRI